MTIATATVIRIGTGIVRSSPWPSQRNSGGTPDTATASVVMFAMPRATLIVPSVAMNGVISATVIMKPLISPQTAPTAMPATIAMGIATWESTMSRVATTPAKAATAPTERSIPAVMITMVIPMATIAVTAVCVPTLRRLWEVRKLSDENVR